MIQIESLGIVGYGFVGEAVYAGFEDQFNVEVYDTDPEKVTCNSLLELAKLTNIFFICVPTPMNKDGSCNTSIVESIVKNLDMIANNREEDPQFIAVIKSTIPPGTTERLNKEISRVTCVFNPEFLTEAASVSDFLNQNRIIIGGPRPASTVVRTIYNKAFPNVHTIKTSSTVAELVKYMTNTFLATKVAFANEFYQVCEALDEDYDKVLEYFLYDDRIGNTHLNVPGPDMHFGFGGSCFVKDLNAFKMVAKKLNIDTPVIDGAWEKNLEVRPERDWEKLVGRAVTKE